MKDKTQFLAIRLDYKVEDGFSNGAKVLEMNTQFWLCDAYAFNQPAGDFGKLHCPYEDYDITDAHYRNLVLQSRIYSDHDSDSPSLTIGYMHSWIIEVLEAQRMAKTLCRINRSIDKMKSAEGDWRTIGQYLNRLARATGATWFLIRKSPEAAERTGEKYSWNRAGEACNEIDNITYRWRYAMKEKAKTELQTA